MQMANYNNTVKTAQFKNKKNLCMYKYIYTHIYECMYICIYLHINAYTYMHLYMCIYMYTMIQYSFQCIIRFPWMIGIVI